MASLPLRRCHLGHGSYTPMLDEAAKNSLGYEGLIYFFQEHTEKEKKNIRKLKAHNIETKHYMVKAALFSVILIKDRSGRVGSGQVWSNTCRVDNANTHYK